MSKMQRAELDEQIKYESPKTQSLNLIQGHASILGLISFLLSANVESSHNLVTHSGHTIAFCKVFRCYHVLQLDSKLHNLDGAFLLRCWL